MATLTMEVPFLPTKSEATSFPPSSIYKEIVLNLSLHNQSIRFSTSSNLNAGGLSILLNHPIAFVPATAKTSKIEMEDHLEALQRKNSVGHCRKELAGRYRASFPILAGQEALDGPAKYPKAIGMSNPDFQLCYRNAALQSLLHCATFVNWTQFHDETTCIRGYKRVGVTERSCIICFLSLICSTYWVPGGNSRELDRVLTTFFGWGRNNDWDLPGQQDSEEWVRWVLAKARESVPEIDTSYTNEMREVDVIEALFHMELKHINKCTGCNKESLVPSDNESTLQVKLPLGGHGPSNISALIRETLNGTLTKRCDNESCPLSTKDGEGCEHSSRRRILNSPEILIVALSRGVYDVETGSFIKNPAQIKYPRILSLTRFLDRDHDTDSLEYELVSVVSHEGEGMKEGHYLANAKTPYFMEDGEARWTYIRIDDYNIWECDIGDILHPSSDYGLAPYLLFYTKIHGNKRGHRHKRKRRHEDQAYKPVEEDESEYEDEDGDESPSRKRRNTSEETSFTGSSPNRTPSKTSPTNISPKVGGGTRKRGPSEEGEMEDAAFEAQHAAKRLRSNSSTSKKISPKETAIRSPDAAQKHTPEEPSPKKTPPKSSSLRGSSPRSSSPKDAPLKPLPKSSSPKSSSPKDATLKPPPKSSPMEQTPSNSPPRCSPPKDAPLKSPPESTSPKGTSPTGTSPRSSSLRSTSPKSTSPKGTSSRVISKKGEEGEGSGAILEEETTPTVRSPKQLHGPKTPSPKGRDKGKALQTSTEDTPPRHGTPKGSPTSKSGSQKAQSSAAGVETVGGQSAPKRSSPTGALSLGRGASRPTEDSRQSGTGSKRKWELEDGTRVDGVDEESTPKRKRGPSDGGNSGETLGGKSAPEICEALDPPSSSADSPPDASTPSTTSGWDSLFDDDARSIERADEDAAPKKPTPVVSPSSQSKRSPSSASTTSEASRRKRSSSDAAKSVEIAEERSMPKPPSPPGPRSSQTKSSPAQATSPSRTSPKRNRASSDAAKSVEIIVEKSSPKPSTPPELRPSPPKSSPPNPALPSTPSRKRRRSTSNSEDAPTINSLRSDNGINALTPPQQPKATPPPHKPRKSRQELQKYRDELLSVIDAEKERLRLVERELRLVERREKEERKRERRRNLLCELRKAAARKRRRRSGSTSSGNARIPLHLPKATPPPHKPRKSRQELQQYRDELLSVIDAEKERLRLVERELRLMERREKEERKRERRRNLLCELRKAAARKRRRRRSE